MTPTMRMSGAAAAVLALVLAVGAAGCGGSESRKARHVEQGEQFMAERNYAKARLEFRNALQIDPKDAEVRALAGLAAERLGRYDDAVKLYRVALTANPGIVLARSRLARILAVAGLPEEARELVSEGLLRTPDAPALLGVRAMLNGQSGDLAAARADAERAYALDPENPEVVAALVAARWTAAERDDAITLLRKAIEAAPGDVELRVLLARLLLQLGRSDDAARELSELVRIEPSRIEYSSLLAQIYVRQGEADRAIEVARRAAGANPDSVETRLALAQLLAAHRSFAEAEKQLDAFRRGSPGDYPLQLGIAEFYVRNGRDELAAATYRGIIEATRKQSWAQMARSQLAALELRRGRVAEASALVAGVLSENASDAEALATRAEISLQRGDTGSAIADLRTALSGQPDSVALAVALSRAYAQAGQADLAEQTLRSLVQTSPGDAKARLALARFLVDNGKAAQARPVVEQLVADQPDSIDALGELFRLQLDAREIEAALHTAGTIQSLQPDSPRGLFLKGTGQQRLGRVDEARAAFEQAAAADPRALDPIAALVTLELNAGQPARALARVDERLNDEPSKAPLLALRGDVLMQLGRAADAAASYRAAAQASPRWPAAYRGQASAYRALGQPDRAVDALKAGLEGTDGSEEVAALLTALYTELGRSDEAVDLAEATLLRHPRSLSAMNNVAMMLATHRADERSLDRAESLARQFADSTNPNLLDTYGWVLYRRGRYPEAVVVLERVVARAPGARSYRYHLGMAQIAAGQRDQARANLEVALKGGAGFSGDEEAAEALRALQ